MENNILIEQMTSKDIDGVFEVEKIVLNIIGLKMHLKKN